MAIRNKKKKIKEKPTQVILTGSNIRLETAKSSRQQKSQDHVVISVGRDISPVHNFLDFLREHAVVGLIIGFVLGTQVQSLVKQLVQSFLDPLTQLLFGTALSDRTFVLHFHGRAANFAWGAMVYALVIFLFVLITMYVIIRLLNLDELEEEKK
jgi:large-conductance mechanosensitive channel